MSKTTRFTKLPKSYVRFRVSDASFFPVSFCKVGGGAGGKGGGALKAFHGHVEIGGELQPHLRPGLAPWQPATRKHKKREASALRDGWKDSARQWEKSSKEGKRWRGRRKVRGRGRRRSQEVQNRPAHKRRVFVCLLQPKTPTRDSNFRLPDLSTRNTIKFGCQYLIEGWSQTPRPPPPRSPTHPLWAALVQRGSKRGGGSLRPTLGWIREDSVAPTLDDGRSRGVLDVVGGAGGLGGGVL